MIRQLLAELSSAKKSKLGFSEEENCFDTPYLSRAMWTLSTGNPFQPGHEVSEAISLIPHSSKKYK